MRPAHLTTHVVERYQERVANLPAEEVWRILSAPVFLLAIQFGAVAVLLPTRQRVVIRNGMLISVWSDRRNPGSMDPSRDELYRPRFNVPDAPDRGWSTAHDAPDRPRRS